MRAVAFLVNLFVSQLYFNVRDWHGYGDTEMDGCRWFRIRYDGRLLSSCGLNTGSTKEGKFVGSVLGYRPDGPGFVSRQEQEMLLLLNPSRPAVPTQTPVQWVPDFFPDGKAAGT